MLGRPRKIRRVGFNPELTYFKPAGIPLRHIPILELKVEEAEAIRLSDYEGLDQQSAAKKMDVSRITYLRVLHTAHKKVSEALILGKGLSIKGGDFVMKPKGRNKRGLGGTEYCMCPECGKKVIHQKGTPCYERKCPDCKCSMRGKFCS